MALNRVDLGIQYFPQFAADRAIANAQIYIGLPNLDPAISVNQIAVFVIQENGTQVAVPQPIRTSSGGVPTFNGSPVQIAVDDVDYSIKALSSTGSQLYYFPSISDLGLVVTNASAVVYDPLVDPATTVETRLREHDSQLENIEGNLNFTTLPSATLPVDNADLFLLRQGDENKKLTASVLRTELAADAEAAAVRAEQAEVNAEIAEVNAEAARDAAFINADVYANTAAGLAATVVGDQFQVISNGESIRYRHDTGPVATELVRFPTSDVAGGVAINNRIINYSRKTFEAVALKGALAADMQAASALVWNLNGSNEIAITGGTSDVNPSYFWVGHERLAGEPLIAEAEFTADNGAVARRFMIAIGTPGSAASAHQYFLSGAGTLDFQINNVSQASYNMAALVASSAGQRVRVKLVLDGSGNGYLYASTPLGNACVAITSAPAGKVFVGWRSTSTGTIHSFTAVKSDYTDAPIERYDTQMIRNEKNLLPTDWTRGEAIATGSAVSNEWRFDTGAGTGSIVNLGDYYGVELVGIKAIRTFVDIEAGAFPTAAYHVRLEKQGARTYFNNIRIFIQQLNASAVQVASNEFFLQSFEEKDSITGTIALNAATTRILFLIGAGTAGYTCRVSMASLAFSDRAGFRPWAETSLDLANERLDVLESFVTPATPILLTFHPLPDSTPSRVPAGFTCTGIDKITRGAYAGCWIVADDGRLVQADASPFAPKVHVLTPDFRKILVSFSLGYNNSAQGVAVDTSGSEDTFWVATSEDFKLRHYNLYGASAGQEIAGDVFDWTAAGYASNPNGLAYNAASDALYVMPATGNQLRLISCDPLASPRLLDTKTIPSVGLGLDQLHLDLANDLIYATTGNNGVDGTVNIYRLSTPTLLGTYTAQRSQAIEGVYIDRAQGRMYIMSDGGYHNNAAPAINMAAEYQIRLFD